MTGQLQFTIIASRYRDGRTPYLTWSGTAESRDQAKARAAEAVDLACKALSAARGIDPKEPPEFHVKTSSTDGLPDGSAPTGESIWAIGPSLHRHVVGTLSKERAPSPTFDEAWPWMEAMAHEAAKFGVDCASYGVHFQCRTISTTHVSTLKISHWLLENAGAPMRTRVIEDHDAVARLMTAWTAVAFTEPRNGSSAPAGAQAQPPHGDLQATTLRAARASALRDLHGEALAKGRAWIDAMVAGVCP